MGIKHNFTPSEGNPVSLAQWVDDHTIDSDLDLGTHALIAPKITAKTSGGLTLEANDGTDIAIMGAANTANVTWYGSHNFDAATANTVAIFGASKTLSSGGGYSNLGLSSLTPTNLVWTGTTAPSGAENHKHSFSRIGNFVTGFIRLEWATVGSALTTVTFDLPSGWPAPDSGNLVLGADGKFVSDWALMAFSVTATGAAGRSFLQRNAADTGWTVFATAASGGHRFVYINLRYSV